MKYVKFQDKELSKLGFGIMRLPTVEPDGCVDDLEAEKLVRYAYENGVNYFDTAYIYHGGKSEETIGKYLAKFPRETWYLANKWPGNFITVKEGKFVVEVGPNAVAEVYDSPKAIFETQLSRCGVEYFDFYLLHNVTESTYDLYTDDGLGIVEYMLSEKKAGRIKHLGFSTHGKLETIENFINKYDYMEFCQIQINYLDWSLQDGERKYNLLTERDIPVIVMEPVRGGKLANVSPQAEKLLKAARPESTPAEWAFRFLYSLPNVYVVLSGMSTMEQVVENVEIFSKEDFVTDTEKALLQQVVDEMAEFVPCTACRYCTASCPQKLDISELINTYNEAAVEFNWLVGDVLGKLTAEEKPSACIHCGVCMPHCPQNIDIPGVMTSFAGLIEKQELEKK